MDQTGETPERQGSGDLPTIKMYQDIVDRAHTEVRYVRDVYKWLLASLTIIISVGIVMAVYLTYNNIHEMRNDMQHELAGFKEDMKADRSEMRSDMKAERADNKTEIELLKARAKQDYLQLETELKSSVAKSVHDVEGKVKTRIDTEFNDKNIHGLVEATAKERVDKIAEPYINQQIDKKIAPKLIAVDNKLEILNKRNELTVLGDKAIGSGDSKAFDKLSDIDLNEEANNTGLYDAAEAEGTRIEALYLNGSRIPYDDLEYKTKEGAVLKNESIPTQQLINELLHSSDYKRRGKAARLLKDRKERIVPNALLQSINNTEERLDVRKETTLSFKELSGYKGDNSVLRRDRQ